VIIRVVDILKRIGGDVVRKGVGKAREERVPSEAPPSSTPTMNLEKDYPVPPAESPTKWSDRTHNPPVPLG